MYCMYVCVCVCVCVSYAAAGTYVYQLHTCNDYCFNCLESTLDIVLKFL